jgi:hypothetical protein
MVAPGEREAEALLCWRAAFSLSALVTLFPIFGFLDFPMAGRAVAVTRLVTLFWSLLLVGFLVAQRRRPRVVPSLLSFGLAPMPLLLSFWVTEEARNVRGLPIELFSRENFTSLLIAAMTPPLPAITLVAIAAFTAQNLLMYLAGPVPLIPEVTRGEPWVGLMIGAASAVLALYRAARLRRDVALVAARERSKALERLTRSFLAVRDFANTPLQTLEVAVALLGKQCPGAGELVARMARSVARLRGLNQMLDGGREGIGEQKESFDAAEVIQEQPR